LRAQRRRDQEVAAGPKIAEKSHFHGKAEVDPVTGRSWLEPPKDLKKPDNEYCYLPKKWIHTWSGHTKGVNAIRRALFPHVALAPCMLPDGLTCACHSS
jgi:pre-mRNA-processing factor 17